MAERPQEPAEIPHNLERAGYVVVRNPSAPADGYWKIGNRRVAIYARKDLSVGEQINAAEEVVKVGDKERKEDEERMAASRSTIWPPKPHGWGFDR